MAGETTWRMDVPNSSGLKPASREPWRVELWVWCGVRLLEDMEQKKSVVLMMMEMTLIFVKGIMMLESVESPFGC